ncbi:tRNA (5-methylaminomethyl-2-thiouridine)(34)-methyltransferase MnmD [Geminocystis sp. NIES-3709]|uniref:tRNA (5-methylaminomethyl-2-thiouridine)(34)-methyltransferase MnmD n=1 Tax=Geminocystis sp. NIES-3709 TaxID=1617448 RepID=UPI0005FCC9F1|nr:MnmC family methyltransferase [Geminocystis sp. NIES-3709]BAQ66439.1 SAM-dependent methyltransferase [Geminocystis sp. NIES-3709]
MTFFETIITADGSETFYSSQFGETFHTKYGAKTEAEITYIQGCQIAEKINQKNSIKILDVCYGLGYNTAAALDYIIKLNSQCSIEIIALELDETVPYQAIKNNLLHHWSSDIIKILTQLLAEKKVNLPLIKMRLLIGDARQTIQTLVAENFQADAIFLDPFSPPKCPQLWTVEFLSLVSKSLNQNGIIATYSCSAGVRKAFQLAGFTIGNNLSVGRRSPGTIATKGLQPLSPLTQMELEHLQTRAAIPFRDYTFQDTAEMIISRREKEQSISILEPTSQWKKRWFS